MTNAGLLAAYRDELLRWNRQINLLSRRETAATADRLISQCADAFELWWEASGAGLAAGGRLRWFDLGSGGGLPAFVWLVLLSGRGVAVDAALVEPRAKRAWFLERLAHLPGAPVFTVIASRWGEAPAPPARADRADHRDLQGAPILFSLKALRLPEAAILGGLQGLLGNAAGRAPAASGAVPVEIVRFQPSAGVTAAGLAADLDVPAVGRSHACGGLRFAAGEARYLAPPGGAAGAAGLFVTRHTLMGPDSLP